MESRIHLVNSLTVVQPLRAVGGVPGPRPRAEARHVEEENGVDLVLAQLGRDVHTWGHARCRQVLQVMMTMYSPSHSTLTNSLSFFHLALSRSTPPAWV